jgi:4-hydroxybenzoate polyprenyltransferase
MSDPKPDDFDLEDRLRQYELRHGGGPSRWRPYLQLMRLPNVFTAMADVTMGFLFVQGTTSWVAKPWTATPWDIATLVTLIAASSALYIAGVVLNDVFDIDIDREERPERPIPSGRIPLDSARRLGWRLLFAGVALASATAFFTGHLRPGVAAALVATAIVLYDAWLKRTPVGPLAMGACRMLNVLMGMSAVEGSLHAEHWLVAGAIGVYVAGITLFAKTENRQSNRGLLVGAMGVMLGGLAMLAMLPHYSHRLILPLMRSPRGWYLLVGAMGLLIAWRCSRAVLSPTPVAVRRAVTNAILMLVMLDAATSFSVRGSFAVVVGMILVFWLPAAFLGRWIRAT